MRRVEHTAAQLARRDGEWGWGTCAGEKKDEMAAEGREKQINEMTQLLNAEKTSRTHAGTAE